MPQHSLKHRFLEEFKRFAWLFSYIFLFLMALAAYRAMLTGQNHPSFDALVRSFIEASVLGKVIMLGGWMGVGERLRRHRLFIIVIYRSIAFALFTLAFGAIEHVVVEWFKGKPFTEIQAAAKDLSLSLIVARGVVLFVFFLPLFALWGLGRRLGEAKMHELFFARQPPSPSPPPPSPHSPTSPTLAA